MKFLGLLSACAPSTRCAGRTPPRQSVTSPQVTPHQVFRKFALYGYGRSRKNASGWLGEIDSE
jgi:hypothetical protein